MWMSRCKNRIPVKHQIGSSALRLSIRINAPRHTIAHQPSTLFTRLCGPVAPINDLAKLGFTRSLIDRPLASIVQFYTILDFDGNDFVASVAAREGRAELA
jgi:hypothetical protein